MKKIFLKSMFAVAAVAMVSCGSEQAEKQEEAVVALPLIEAQTVTSRAVVQQAVFTGLVEAQVVNNIAPQQPLRIKEIRFDVGDHVKKGDLLVVLDASSLAQAKAQLDNAKKEYERTNELYEFGGASKSEWDARRLQYEVAETAYNNLVENTTLISPISGVVTARNYDKGDMYTGQPVLVIEQIKPVKIMINVSEPFFGKVKKGMPVSITLDAYGEEVFKGKIARIYPTIDQATHTFQIEVTIPNNNERVRPGMYARVTLSYGKQNNVVIPDRAVQKLMGSGDRYVFVYNPADSTVRYSKVELGRRLDNEFEVFSGVKSGEMVVTKGHMGITNGAKVELVK
ncbi:MAG: efflux RND transporter periplasmic adaptor subunit [Alistipes sp.]|jgi:RND family efflux transporter MFP subunit|nr:efflux RND transporter periplasmic adaptor subunit [Alistipes sp.]